VEAVMVEEAVSVEEVTCSCCCCFACEKHKYQNAFRVNVHNLAQLQIVAVW
jgi:hypothetical protein